MSTTDLLREAYNAHEWAESAAMDAMRAKLEQCSSDALMALADPTWRWDTRSWMSEAIIDQADDVLNARLDALLQKEEKQR